MFSFRLFALGLLFALVPAQAARLFFGNVVDENQTPLVGVRVSLRSSPSTHSISDSVGYFSVDLATSDNFRQSGSNLPKWWWNRGDASISIVLSQPTGVDLVAMDAMGRKVFEKQVHLESGKHRIDVPRAVALRWSQALRVGFHSTANRFPTGNRTAATSPLPMYDTLVLSLKGYYDLRVPFDPSSCTCYRDEPWVMLSDSINRGPSMTGPDHPLAITEFVWPLEAPATDSDGVVARWFWSRDGGVTWPDTTREGILRVVFPTPGTYSFVVKVQDDSGAFSAPETLSVRAFQSMQDPRDGRRYRIVTIGNQIWMAENLNFGRWVSPSSDSDNDSMVDKHCYAMDSSKCGTFGAYYQQSEAFSLPTECYTGKIADTTICIVPITQRTQGICPDGWHIPDRGEWAQLYQAVSDSLALAGGSPSGPWSGIVHAMSEVNADGTNRFGFSDPLAGTYDNWGSDQGTKSEFWVSGAPSLSLITNSKASNVAQFLPEGTNIYYRAARSIRCVQGAVTYQPPAPTLEPPPNRIAFDDSSIALTVSAKDPYRRNLTYFWSWDSGRTWTDSTPSNAITKLLRGSSMVFAQVKAVNYRGVSSAPASFTIRIIHRDSITDSRDGKVYRTVRLGDKIWLAENLAYLPRVDSVKQFSNTAPCYYVYDYTPVGANDSEKIANARATANYKQYGVLYNWPAASQSQICPTGWHAPTMEEFRQMALLVDSITVRGGYSSGTAQGYFPKVGGVLQTTYGWNSGGNGSDLVGFGALPAGTRKYDWSTRGLFGDKGAFARFWTTDYAGTNNGTLWYAEARSSALFGTIWMAEEGQSLRCLMPAP